jgi:hypothetical protein
MPGWLLKALKRIRELAIARNVLFTLKALRELAELELGLDEEDACDVLANLTPDDSGGRLKSATTGEWMYIFKPQLSGTELYVKLILRSGCVLISFHEDEGEKHEEDE